MIKKIIKPVVEELGKLGETAINQVKPKETSQDETKQLVKDLYKPQEESSPQELMQKQAEDKKKTLQLRQILHQQYAQPLLNHPKPKEEPKAEKLEKEKKMEEFEFQEKEKKKPPPLAVQRAQKVEKYPGAGG